MIIFGKLAHTAPPLLYINMFFIRYRLYCILCDEVVFVVKSFLLIFLIIFAVAGICEFVYIIKMFFYFPNIRVKNYSLVVLKRGYEVKQLNYIWQKVRWHGDAFACGIIAVTDDIEIKEFLDCNIFIRDKNIILCTVESISMCEQLQGS